MSKLARLHSKTSRQQTTQEKHLLHLLPLPSGFLLAGDEAWPQIDSRVFWVSAGGTVEVCSRQRECAWFKRTRVMACVLRTLK